MDYMCWSFPIFYGYYHIHAATWRLSERRADNNRPMAEGRKFKLVIGRLAAKFYWSRLNTG
jgi:hypothetical protein